MAPSALDRMGDFPFHTSSQHISCHVPGLEQLTFRQVLPQVEAAANSGCEMHRQAFAAATCRTNLTCDACSIVDWPSPADGMTALDISSTEWLPSDNKVPTCPFRFACCRPQGGLAQHVALGSSSHKIGGCRGRQASPWCGSVAMHSDGWRLARLLRAHPVPKHLPQQSCGAAAC